MKNLFIDCPKAFFNKIKTQDKEFKKIFIICAILTLCVLISFWVSSFAVITCVFSAISMLFIKGAKKIYILVYLLPFYHVIKLTPSGFVLCSIVLVVAIILLGIEFIIDIIRKNRKIDYIITGLFGAIVVYIILPFGPFNLMNVLKLISTMAILYLVYVNKEDLDFKHLVYILLTALLIACSFSPLRYVSSRLECFLPDFPAYVKDYTRFSGLTSDPNYFAIEILLLIGCGTQLYLTNKMGKGFYFILFVLSIIGFFTISKAYLLTYCLFVICMEIFWIIKKYKGKERVLEKVLIFNSVIIIAILISFPQVMAGLGRFDNSYVDFDKTYGAKLLNEFTTGRSEIWILYAKEILSSSKNCLFGHGLGAQLPTTSHGLTAAHNFYLECLYHLGIFGSILLFALVVYMFVRSSKKTNRRYINFIPLIIVAFMLLSLNSLISYRPYILVILLSYSINLQDKKEEFQDKNGEGNAKSIDNNERI